MTVWNKFWATGSNVYGQLGLGNLTDRDEFTQVGADTNWSVLACGDDHAMAIKTDGTLWTWGDNGFGQLGDNTITDKSSPVQTITGGTDWSSIFNTAIHTEQYRILYLDPVLQSPPTPF